MNESILLKKDGESDFEYHKRLVYGKLIDKTLADYDYSELSGFVYGKDYSADVARRMMYGSQKTLEMLDECNTNTMSDSLILAEMDRKKIDIQKERQRLSDQRREFNKLVNSEGRAEHLYNIIIDSANNINESVGVMYNEKVASSYSDNEAVLVLNDWHYGMTTNNIYNTYNTDVCKERVYTVAVKARERILSNKCNKLTIVLLGDFLHGAVHVGTRVASEELVCDQLMNVAEILAQTIEWMSECVESVDVYYTYGNHARTVQNKNDSIHRDNMERIIGWWLKQRLSLHDDINITDESETEFLCFNVCGYTFAASHGDLDSVKSSPRLLHTLFYKQYGKDVKYVLLGDKHHDESFSELGIESIICGALCGTDDYANDKRLFSTPTQLLLIVNKDEGVDAEYKLKCEM